MKNWNEKKQLTNEEKFIEASKKERYGLKYILPHIKKLNTKYTWTDYMTDIYSYDVYDCLLQAYDNGSKKKIFIIEVKVRDTHYPELILETKKLRDLKTKILHPTITDILYINITPMGTYIFNVSRLEKEGKLIPSKLTANKATMTSRTDKVEKGVIMLDINEAKFIDFTFNQLQYERDTKLDMIIKQNNEYKATKDMWDYLTKM